MPTCRESSCGSPGEIIAADSVCAQEHLKRWIGIAGAAVTPVPSAYFDSLAGERGAQGRTRRSELGGFGSFSRAELAAIGALLKYVELTQIGRKPVIRPPRKTGADGVLVIDAASRGEPRARGRARAARTACSPPSTAR